MKNRGKPYSLILWMSLFFQLAPYALAAQSVDLVITYIRGSAVRESGRKALQEGQVIGSGEKIHFMGDKDFLIAISTGSRQARYRISRQADQSPAKGSESWEQVALMMRLLWETPSLVTRSDQFPLLETEFRVDSTINPRMLFTPLNKYLYEPGKYLIDADHFFFLQQQHQGKVESQPLSTIKDTLLIGLGSFMKLQESLGDDHGSYYLGYFDKTNNKAKRIAAVEPAFDQEGMLGNLAHAVSQALGPEAGSKEVFNETYAEAYYFMGRPSMISLMEIINTLHLRKAN
jgi:hypothetical protein